MDIQSIGIIVSIGIGVTSNLLDIWQVRLQAKQTKASVAALLSSQLDNLNEMTFEYPDVYNELSKPHEPSSNYVETRAELLMDRRLNLLEHAYLQYTKYHLIDKEEWEDWKRLLEYVFRSPFAKSYWKSTKDLYTADFVK